MRAKKIKPLRVTVEMLKQAGACEGDVRKFKKLWPNGCRPTLRNCQRAVRAKLDLQWAGDALLSGRAADFYGEHDGRIHVRMCDEFDKTDALIDKRFPGSGRARSQFRNQRDEKTYARRDAALAKLFARAWAMFERQQS